MKPLRMIEQKRQEMSRGIKLVIKILIVLSLFVLAIFVGLNEYKKYEEELYKGEGGGSSQAREDTVIFEGEKYKYNYNLKNILFLGVDNDAEVSLDNHPGEGGQADTIMILSIDDEEKKAQILQISRDTMTEVDVYDWSGEYYVPIQAQIATQYAYAKGAQGSCRAMEKTVSELLYDLPIRGYISLDIAGVSVMNDQVGGVPITVPEDYSYVDSAFVKGAALTLTGSQAEKYVRYRDTTVSGSNNMRMRRQVEYVPALVEACRTYLDGGEENAEAFYEAMEPYMLTNLSTKDIEEILEYDWEIKNVSYLPGEVKMGEQYEEFYVDEEAMLEVMVKLFYKKK